MASPTTFGSITTALYTKIMTQEEHLDDALACVCRAKSQARSEARRAMKIAADTFRAQPTRSRYQSGRGEGSIKLAHLPNHRSPWLRFVEGGIPGWPLPLLRLDAFSPAHHLCLRKGIHYCSRLVLSFQWVPLDPRERGARHTGKLIEGCLPHRRSGDTSATPDWGAVSAPVSINRGSSSFGCGGQWSWEGGGVGSNALLLMYGCSTLIRLRTTPPLSLPATSTTSRRNGVDMIGESEKWSDPLFSPLCSLPLEDAARVPLHW